MSKFNRLILPVAERSRILKLIGLVTLVNIIILLIVSCEEDMASGRLIQVKNLEFIELKAFSLERNENTLTATVPYGTNIKSLTPHFELSGEGEIIPALGGPFDFSKPVYFTVVSRSGGRQVYTFIVKTESQPTPVLIGLSAPEVEAGKTVQIFGRHFGSYRGDISVTLFDEESIVLLKNFRLVGPDTLECTFDKTTLPGQYQINVQVKELGAVLKEGLRVTYPPPAETAPLRRHLLQGDTLTVRGRFLNQKYGRFQCNLSVSQISGRFLALPQQQTETLQFLLSADFPSGLYNYELVNLETGGHGEVYAEAVNIYDARAPFITSIENPVVSSGDTVVFQAQYFQPQSIRFYQLELGNGSVSHIINGIYDASREVLRVALPKDIPKGSYHISFLLSNPSLRYQYSFAIDPTLTVR